MEELVVEALIEIPQGCQNKYEVDKKTGRVKLDRTLYSAMLYPGEYGYIENTLAKDGDPIDIVVFASFPTFPGCLMRARVIGVLEMTDDGDEDVKLIAVSQNDPRYASYNCLEDLPPHYLVELRNFFDTYKLLNNKVVKTGDYLGIEEARHFLRDARERYYEQMKIKENDLI
ncbi:MAG: inorganic diphosphatase [Bacilli bacterium]|nr:inorganic diphosphatase [Bacilli bacterium]